MTEPQRFYFSLYDNVAFSFYIECFLLNGHIYGG